MSPNDNKTLVRALFRALEVMSDTREFAPIEAVVAEDAAWHGTTGEAKGLEEIRRNMAASPGKAAFSETRFEIHDLVAEGDRVCARFTHSALNSGPFWGSPPTNTRASWEGIAVYRIEGGKVAELWTTEDMFSVFMQLGLLGPPEPQPA